MLHDEGGVTALIIGRAYWQGMYLEYVLDELLLFVRMSKLVYRGTLWCGIKNDLVMFLCCQNAGNLITNLVCSVILDSK